MKFKATVFLFCCHRLGLNFYQTSKKTYLGFRVSDELGRYSISIKTIHFLLYVSVQDSSQASPELIADMMKTSLMTGEAHDRIRYSDFRGAVVKLPELRQT